MLLSQRNIISFCWHGCYHPAAEALVLWRIRHVGRFNPGPVNGGDRSHRRGVSSVFSSDSTGRCRDLTSGDLLSVSCKQRWVDYVLGRMDGEGVRADSCTYGRVLQACKDADSLSDGKWVHAQLVESGLERERFVANHLLSMYGRCGSLEDARWIFDGMGLRRNVVSWNAMMAVYGRRGCGKEALQLFRRMQVEGTIPAKITFVTVLNACPNAAALADGRLIHAWIVQRGLERDVVVGNAIVSMYGRCGALDDSRRMFDKMLERDVVSWNSIFTAYAHRGRSEDVMELFRQMQVEEVMPNNITFVALLNGCLGLAALAEGKVIHACIVDRGCESHVVVGTAIVSMYGRCKALDDARGMFDKMPKRDEVSWTAMITAYSQHGYGKKAFQVFHRMQMEGFMPSKITFIAMLNACSSLAALGEGRMIHACIVERGFEPDVVVATAIVNMYGKCGSLDDACNIFDNMAARDTASWNAMIGTYSQHGYDKEVLRLFRRMQLGGVEPNRITFTSVLNACATMGILGEGRLIHACIVERGLELDVVLGTAIIGMYGKCVSLLNARRIFDIMPERNVVSWNAMIGAYARHGHAMEAFQFFALMQMEGVIPDEITFANLLFVCSQIGLVDEGYAVFASMIKNFGILPMAAHFSCMICLLGQAGMLNEAEDFLNKMPFEPDTVAWMTLLDSCRIHGDLERGKLAAQQLLEVDPQNAAVYIVLSGITASAVRSDDVGNMRNGTVDRDVGEWCCSTFSANNSVHEFVASDRSLSQMERIYAELELLSRQIEEEGYNNATKLVLHEGTLPLSPK